jgi:hypothetical protein
MDSFLELQQAVQSDLTVGDESSLFPIATIKLAINRAYRKSAGLFRWPETEDAKKTSTEENQEYYDYPQNWRPDSVWKVTVDDVDYGDPLSFKDYLYEKEEDLPSGKEYMWTSQWRRFFLYPTPTTNGSNNITVWGQEIVAKLADDTDVTIFSYSMPECNDAIVMEAVAILKSKGNDSKTGEMVSIEAKKILATSWSKVRQEQAKYEKTLPFFDVPDLFAGNVTTKDIWQ